MHVVDREGISEVMLWAKDLKGTFTLLRFHPSQDWSVDSLSSARVEIWWVGTPYAFNVISRTLDTITAHTIEGAGVWYVDDLNACSNRRTVDSDMSAYSWVSRGGKG